MSLCRLMLLVLFVLLVCATSFRKKKNKKFKTALITSFILLLIFRICLQKSSLRGFQDISIKTNIFTLVMRLQKTSSRCLDQDEYISLGHMSSRRLQDVFKTSSRRFQDVFKMSSRHLQNLHKTFCRHIVKISSKHLQEVLKIFEENLLKRCLRHL